MQLNQVPVQVVEPPPPVVENALNERPEELPRPGIADIPAPVVWAVAMVIGLMLLGGTGRRT